MREDAEPAFWERVLVKLVARGDAVEREKIVGHHPCGREVRRGGNEIAYVRGGVAAAAYDDCLVVARVSGRKFDADAGHNLALAGDQFHLSAADERIVIVCEIADAI